MARLSHPNIVTLHDVYERDGSMYLVVEFVDGWNLAAVLEKTPILSAQPEFLLRILRDTSAALDYAHANQIIHRDVKPANLLLDRSGLTKITDFGIAKAAGPSTMTLTGTVVATADFMSPEQVKGAPVDGRTDQFSLAVVAHLMLTGRGVFEGDSLASLTSKICHERNPGLSPGVDRVLGKALSKLPGDRFGTCGEFVAALSDEMLTLQRGRRAGAPAAVFPGSGRPTRPWMRVAIPASAGISILAAGAYYALARAPVPPKPEESVARPATIKPARSSEAATADPSRADPQPPGAPPPPYGPKKLETPQRIKVAEAIQAAKLIHKVIPTYPPLGKAGRIQGMVRFTAIIWKDGAVRTLQLQSGHPLLVPSALDAVRQWVYRPTLLNGEAVEVATQIDVHFTLSQ